VLLAAPFAFSAPAIARHHSVAPLLLRTVQPAVHARAGPPAVASLASLAAGVGPLVGVPTWAFDATCSVLLVIASVAWIKICNLLSGSGITSPYISRKLVHMGSGPLFILCWPLFSTTPSGQAAAIAVPVLSVIRLLVAGRSPDNSERGAELVRAISRTGERSEALGGPMIYTLVLLVGCAFGWRSLVSAIAVCQMAIGDGMADIIGRRFGRTKWPFAFAGEKSVEGSAAFAAFAWIACMLMVALFHVTGLSALTMMQAAGPLLIISLSAAAIELLPLGDDNFTVPLVAAIMSICLLGGT